MSTTLCRNASILRLGTKDRPHHSIQDLDNRRKGTPAVAIQPVEGGKGGHDSDHVLGLTKRAAGPEQVRLGERDGQLTVAVVAGRLGGGGRQAAKEPGIRRPPPAGGGDAVPQSLEGAGAGWRSGTGAAG